MRKTIVLCCFSALMGAVAARIATDLPWFSAAIAQEPRIDLPPRSSSRPAAPSPVEAAIGRTPIPRVQPPGQLTQEEQTSIAVYEAVNRGVVNINTHSVRNDNLFLIEIPSEGAGSGSVLDAQGHILTNLHVIEGAQKIEVTLFNGNSYPAAVVGKDPINDVAVVRIKAPPQELVPVPLGDSSLLRVGQRIYAIGNPFGLERTLTTGIVSSLNRTLPSRIDNRLMKSIIQIDAAMNPGNSGGPLLDTAGQMIGMNTAIATRTGQNTGVGFAIPVNRIRRIVPELIRDGRVTRPDIGITRVMQTERGLLIATLTPGGPAEKAGLRGFRIVRKQQQKGLFTFETQSVDRNAADLIVAVDDQKAKTVDDFLGTIDEKKPGDNVELTVVREGREIRVPVTMGTGEP